MYIEEREEIENFDYRCFSMLYYRCLEEALNSLLYIPYKEEFEYEVLEQINKYGIEATRTDLVPGKIKGLFDYSKKERRYQMVDHLPLGEIAFLCKGLASSRNKTLRD